MAVTERSLLAYRYPLIRITQASSAMRSLLSEGLHNYTGGMGYATLLERFAFTAALAARQSERRGAQSTLLQRIAVRLEDRTRDVSGNLRRDIQGDAAEVDVLMASWHEQGISLNHGVDRLPTVLAGIAATSEGRAAARRQAELRGLV